MRPCTATNHIARCQTSEICACFRGESGDSENGYMYADDALACALSAEGVVEEAVDGAGAWTWSMGRLERLNDQERLEGGRSMLTPRRTAVTGGAYLRSVRGAGVQMMASSA